MAHSLAKRIHIKQNATIALESKTSTTMTTKLTVPILLASLANAEKAGHVSLGSRPFWLVNEMRNNEVKETLRKYTSESNQMLDRIANAFSHQPHILSILLTHQFSNEYYRGLHGEY